MFRTVSPSIISSLAHARLLMMDRDTVRNMWSPEKLLLLLGFIIRIYHDAWFLECPISLQHV